MNYKEFIESKKIKHQQTGFNCDDFNPILFDFQKDLVRYALKQGKSAIFADTGLGKSFMQVEWANKLIENSTNEKILILAPLAVSKQTINEAKKLGVDINYIENDNDVINGINITNYEKLEKFDTSKFYGVVLDESSILKGFTSATKNLLIDKFKHTPYKLACSATPAPNDFMELGNHAEFLNAMTRTEMLSMFFYHDGGDTSKWRLKGHAQDSFWEWVSSWGSIIKNPSDLGYDGSLYNLPPLNMMEHRVNTEYKGDGLFAMPANTLDERRQARKDSLKERCEKVADMVNNSDEIHLIWCDLNAESELLHKLIKDNIEVKGSDKEKHKENSMIDFAAGNVKCLISKPSICGYGMNFQVCHNMAFTGLSDSYEQFYQAVRRCYRFGQKNSVNAHIVISEQEGNVLNNIKRKEKQAQEMQAKMIKYTKKYVIDNLKSDFKELDKSYIADNSMMLPEWLRSEEN